MAKINILPSEVFNRISAGEVVERPKSVVKELIENSIDAGANNITIEIQDGGITFIKITDNGSGIEKEYVETAFLPHATSKVEKYEDLESIATLGFRGEALASIASVSTVELTTKSINESIGTYLELRGGIKQAHYDIDANFGTSITIRNLFFNTPARQKFLKKPKSEESDITSVIQGLILSNPDVAFKYFADDKLVYSSNGGGLENAVYSIYPPSITKYLTYFENQIGDIIVKGYISTPELTKPTRNYQTTIINGRLIKNNIVETAVMKAYGNMLMKRCFPVYAIEILMPFDSLDVNVTPSKTDVRFDNERSVFSAVFRSVEKGLLNNAKSNNSENMVNENDSIFTDLKETKHNTSSAVINNVAQIEKTNNETSIIDSFIRENKDIVNVINQTNSKKRENDTKDILTQRTDNAIKNKFDKQNEKYSDKPKKEDINSIQEAINKINNIKSGININIPSPNSILKVSDIVKTNVNKNNDNIVKSSLFDEIENSLAESSIKFEILGQIFNTYLLVQKGEYLYVIDQHATHESMLYNKLINAINSNSVISQPLLAPQVIILSPNDFAYISDYVEQFEKIGLHLVEFGANTFKVESIPTILNNFDANKFINFVLDEKNLYQDINLKDLLHEKLAMTACKSAIKGNQPLTNFEITKLIKDIESEKPLQCPHGRPTILKLSRKDFDKMFKRIL